MLYALMIVCTGYCTPEGAHKESAETFKSLGPCQKVADTYNAHSLELTAESGQRIDRSDTEVHAHCVPLK